MTDDEIRRQLDRACELQADGRHDEALVILRELEARAVSVKPVTALLGLVLYYGKDDVESALPYLRRAVELSPDSERSSLALYHALFETGDWQGAFSEMRRFLATHDSPKYSRLLDEMIDPDDPLDA